MKKCALVLAVVALALVSADASSESPLINLRHEYLNARMNYKNADLELRVKVLEQKMEALLNGDSPEKVRAIRVDPAAERKVQQLYEESVKAAKNVENKLLKDRERTKKEFEKQKQKESREGKPSAPNSK